MLTVGKVYELVGVRNDDTGVTLFGGEREEVSYSSTLQVGTQSFQQTSTNSVILVKSKVEGRPNLSAYSFHMQAVREADNTLRMTWGHLHIGVASDNPAYNHAPFYSTFETRDKVTGNEKDLVLEDMAVTPNSLTVHFVQEDFNGGKFTAGDITSRMAKPKHMGPYTSRIRISSATNDTPFADGGEMLELSELDVGFGAPRHLLCGQVDAKMTYIFKLQY